MGSFSIPSSSPLESQSDSAASVRPGRANAALEAIDRIQRRKEFGSAGTQLIVEERIEGQDASILAITDGRAICVVMGLVLCSN